MSPTKRQQDALRFIRGYQLAKGIRPLQRETGAACGVDQSIMAACLQRMERDGLIRNPPMLWRDMDRRRLIEVLADIAIPRSPTGEPLYFVRVP